MKRQRSLHVEGAAPKRKRWPILGAAIESKGRMRGVDAISELHTEQSKFMLKETAGQGSQDVVRFCISLEA